MRMQPLLKLRLKKLLLLPDRTPPANAGGFFTYGINVPDDC